MDIPNPNRLKLTKREDGYTFSTIRSLVNWYGAYETAIIHNGNIRIAEGYDTEEEALKGHEKYVNMTADEIAKIDFIG